MFHPNFIMNYHWNYGTKDNFSPSLYLSFALLTVQLVPRDFTERIIHIYKPLNRIEPFPVIKN